MNKIYKNLEVVKILEDKFTNKEGLVGSYGIIQTDGSPYKDDMTWGVLVEDYGIVMLNSNQIQSTGKYITEEELYDGTSLKVKVDPKTGEGDIVD